MSKLVRLLFLAVLFFVITNCGTTKKVTNSTPSSTSLKPKIEIEEEPYVGVSKNERKNYFPTTNKETKWVDSIYKTMSIDEKIGQLFMVAAYSNKDEAHFKDIDKLITENKIGGVIFFQGGPSRQIKLTNRFQAKSKIPLFIGIDAEWGLNMRLDSTYKYPWNMTLGAIRDLKLIEKVGKNMAEDTKRIGAQFNFAPVLDINTNPLNPIIGNRSFGEDKKNVTNHAIALMQGTQSNGIFATGKHFPGHGDTATDSHHTLPQINFSKNRLDVVELYPYKRMFDEGLVSVMVAHLAVPSLEVRENYPSSISYNVVTNLLQEELGFEGLIFTDALNMKGASKFKKPGEIDLEAFKAGNDILLFPENVPLASEKICTALENGEISESRLEKSVKKILRYKYKSGLNHYNPISLDNLANDLNAPEKNALQYELYENAITLLKNKHELVPIEDLSDKIAYVKLGDDSGSTFLNTLKKYTNVTEVFHEKLDSLLIKLKPFSTVIIGYHKSDKAWKKHDFSETELQYIQEIAKHKHVILDVFAKPYTLMAIKDFSEIESIVLSYQNSDIAQEVSAELLFGALAAKGKLPVTINDKFPVDFGLSSKTIDRLGFCAPENVGMDSNKLKQIDAVVKKAIDGKMTPGAQILVARKGKVIFQKSYGYHTYDKKVKVQNSDIYDVASVSKIVGTLPNVMQLYDKCEFGLDTKLGEVLPNFKNSNKASITFKELLSHYARLQAWEPFYKATLDLDKCPSVDYYSTTLRKDFTLPVNRDLYALKSINDTIISHIVKSKLLDKKEYKYSDFTFIILKEYLEKETGKTLEELANTNFFSKLGMNNTMYNPWKRVDVTTIPPTEDDTYFRNARVQGYVHDMTAAMQGGVAGHAGVFSNSIDLAKMMQMYLNKGTYNDVQFFSPETFDAFNTCYFCNEGNRRALGFDKPQLGKEGPTCGCVSKSSFGHTGFTGTMVWADLETEILYVFLSNRTFPDSNAVNKLSKENIREDIQKIIQEAIIK